jgi:IclR family acetate operon transcriptional repressor
MPSVTDGPVETTGVRIQAVARAVRLLMLVATHATDGSGKALAQSAGLATPTAHHLLSTLVQERLLARDERSRFILGPAAAVLADSVRGSGSSGDEAAG